MYIYICTHVFIHTQDTAHIQIKSVHTKSVFMGKPNPPCIRHFGGPNSCCERPNSWQKNIKSSP